MNKILLQEIFRYLKKYRRTTFCFQDVEVIYGKIYHKEMSNNRKLLFTEQLLEDSRFDRTYVSGEDKIKTVFILKNDKLKVG